MIIETIVTPSVVILQSLNMENMHSGKLRVRYITQMPSLLLISLKGKERN